MSEQVARGRDVATGQTFTLRASADRDTQGVPYVVLNVATNDGRRYSKEAVLRFDNPADVEALGLIVAAAVDNFEWIKGRRR